jgi:hypothetical protein
MAVVRDVKIVAAEQAPVPSHTFEGYRTIG